MNNKHVDDIIKEEVDKELQLILNYFYDKIKNKNAVIMIQSVSIMILLFLLIFMSII